MCVLHYILAAELSWLERSTHNREVDSSNLSAATDQIFVLLCKVNYGHTVSADRRC